MRYNRGTLSKLRQIAKVMDLAPSKSAVKDKTREPNDDDSDTKDDEELDSDQTNGVEKDTAKSKSSKKSRP